jgi:N-acetylglucosaminyl-diphospho-decaprenol L-rhamnosyltransferase
VDISIIIVSWNVHELLRRCLQSIASQQSSLATGDWRLATETIVVDNASHDGTVEMLRAEFPASRVRVIANSENLGFTRANNQALAIAQGHYLFLLNPDTELRPGALQNMFEYAEQHSRVGMIGPQLFYGDGSLQSSRRRFPTRTTAFLESTILQQWFPQNRVLTQFYMRDTRDDETIQVDWINGSAMFVRREVYDQIGGFDEAFFMYSEELDWCRRAKEADWQIIYLPSAQITHYEGKSSEQVVARRDIYFHSSKVRYYRKYFGAFFAEILRVFLLATFVFQIARESVKWLLGHKREMRAQRIKAYWQVVRSGLK